MSEYSGPPRIGLAILNFFSTDRDFDAMVGDMSEEFQERVESTGARAAKFWYWRHIFRNAWALTAREVMRTPVRVVVIAMGGVLAVNAVTALYVLYALRGVPLDLHAEQPLDLHAEQWWALLLIQAVAPFILGWAGCRLIRDREWALALIYTAASVCYAGVGMMAIRLWISPQHSIHMPAPLRALAIWGNVFRQAAFWIGCLAAIVQQGSRGLSRNATKRFVAIFAILPLTAISGSTLLGQSAAAPAKWIGTWVLEVEKSIFEAPLLPGRPGELKIVNQTLRIEQTEQNLRLSGDTTYSDNGGSHSSHDETNVRLDGEPTVLGPISLYLRRSNGSTFDMASRLSIGGRNIEEESHFAVSSDGGTLTETKVQTEREGTDNSTTRVIRTSTFVLVFRKLPEK